MSISWEMKNGDEFQTPEAVMIILLWETGIRIWKSCRMALRESLQRASGQNPEQYNGENGDFQFRIYFIIFYPIQMMFGQYLFDKHLVEKNTSF